MVPLLCKRWFDSLDHHAAAKVAVALVRMETGQTSNIKWFSGIGEYKIDWGPGYRIYLLKDGDYLIVLLGGGTKKQQQKDIAKAIELMKEYKSRSWIMALTRDYKETIKERAEKDPLFAASLMQEAMAAFLEGEPETSRVILRELVNSTIGFEFLAEQLDKSSKSIHRMLSPHGNPTMDNLTHILVALQKKLDFDVEVKLSSQNKTPRRTASRRLG